MRRRRVVTARSIRGRRGCCQEPTRDQAVASRERLCYPAVRSPSPSAPLKGNPHDTPHTDRFRRGLFRRRTDRRSARVRCVARTGAELTRIVETRRTIPRLIREWPADIVMGHRPNDYPPDHRYVGILMQDAAYMVTVPHFCPDVPYLTANPAFFFYSDNFQKPNPF